MAKQIVKITTQVIKNTNEPELALTSRSVVYPVITGEKEELSLTSNINTYPVITSNRKELSLTSNINVYVVIRERKPIKRYISIAIV